MTKGLTCSAVSIFCVFLALSLSLDLLAFKQEKTRKPSSMKYFRSIQCLQLKFYRMEKINLFWLLNWSNPSDKRPVQLKSLSLIIDSRWTVAPTGNPGSQTRLQRPIPAVRRVAALRKAEQKSSKILQLERAVPSVCRLAEFKQRTGCCGCHQRSCNIFSGAKFSQCEHLVFAPKTAD